MKGIKSFELPAELRKELHSAIKLEWLTLFYLISVVLAMYLTMGTSQAMKTAWLEDLLSIVPSIVFLIATKINTKSPNEKFRYGYHRVFTIAFLIGATALLGMGLFLVFDSSMSLFKAEHPTINNKILFGHQIWMGWIMILALLYSSIPAMIIGIKKLPKATKLHNKVLYIDAEAQKADYMTAFAAILGILGVGAGLWWADAAAALFISFSVTKDGFKHISTAIKDLMDRYPVSLKEQQKDPLIDDIHQLVSSWEWVEDCRIRFRENGQVLIGEIAVIPKGQVDVEQLEKSYQELMEYHWKINDVTIAPVKELPNW
ncbi:cation diffusion facilitator family transporter [Christiangramia sp.]|uniref:cation diffusion facilitator family transporter n=1 Tax=Christiangramia sp. TaxID=1931228 RepID=UPI0026307564|nr:cation diffusion facilitator family transporter [Christiangramia sp.]